MTDRLLVYALATSTIFTRADVLTRRVENFRGGVSAHETVLTQQIVRSRPANYYLAVCGTR